LLNVKFRITDRFFITSLPTARSRAKQIPVRRGFDHDVAVQPVATHPLANDAHVRRRSPGVAKRDHGLPLGRMRLVRVNGRKRLGVERTGGDDGKGRVA
jgi:hypothetical protein